MLAASQALSFLGVRIFFVSELYPTPKADMFSIDIFGFRIHLSPHLRARIFHQELMRHIVY